MLIVHGATFGSSSNPEGFLENPSCPVDNKHQSKICKGIFTSLVLAALGFKSGFVDVANT